MGEVMVAKVRTAAGTKAISARAAICAGEL